VLTAESLSHRAAAVVEQLDKALDTLLDPHPLFVRSSMASLALLNVVADLVALLSSIFMLASDLVIFFRSLWYLVNVLKFAAIVASQSSYLASDFDALLPSIFFCPDVPLFGEAFFLLFFGIGLSIILLILLLLLFCCPGFFFFC